MANPQVEIWLDYAKGDFAAAKHLLTLYPMRLEIICYHCQQSAEKALKAFLISHGNTPPKTHDLKELCKLSESIDKSFPDLEQECIRLTPYGVQVRYPNEIDLEESDIKIALLDAEKILDFVLKKSS